MSSADDRRDRSPPPLRPLPPLNPPASARPVDDEATRAIVRPQEAPPAEQALAREVTDSPPRATPAPSGLSDNPLLQSSLATPPPTPVTPAEPAVRTGTLPGNASFSTPPAVVEGHTDAVVRQVGRYLIQSRLGRGGMATVYKAHDPSIGRDVAIKFLHSSLAEDEECRMRFLRESRAAGGLSHHNIVVVHDVGEIGARPYMAMELIDGPTLADVLEQERKLPIRDAVVIGLQLARALEYAHARGIVHRDIKPGNMMLVGSNRTVKVTDFGIAHMDDSTLQQRTQVGAVLGTPQYMSPEQTRGEKLDGRSDLFSAGIVLYQMLAGERPFRGESLVAVASQIANAEPPSLAQKRPDAPASLRRVVERCLAKPLAQRYQSGHELADALKKVLLDLDETARQRNKPRIVPLRVKWAVTMGAIVALVMGITATVITQRQQAAMMDQVFDYGASLARFIARQNAAAVLGDEWEAVDVAVQEIMKTRNFERVSVLDRAGLVRVSSVPALVGQPYKPEGTEALGKVDGGVAAIRYLSRGEAVLGFEAPVLYQDKEVGRVALGIPEKPLTRVVNLSISLMIALAVVTVLAVAIAMYFVADWFAKPIKLVEESMAEIAKGRFDHRIDEKRNDEFGMLYSAFDSMAKALQRREGGGIVATPPPSTLTPQTLAMARQTDGASGDPAADERGGSGSQG